MTVVVLWRVEVPPKCSSRCAQATDPSSFRNLWSCPVWVLEEQVLLGLICFFLFVCLFVFCYTSCGAGSACGKHMGVRHNLGSCFSHCTLGVWKTKLGPSGLTVITGPGGVWGLEFGLRDGAQGPTFARQAPNH